VADTRVAADTAAAVTGKPTGYFKQERDGLRLVPFLCAKTYRILTA
jgi:hypothetical protein